MLKTLTAALVAASVLLAPIASSAVAAQPAAKPATTATAPVKLIKKTTKRHVVKSHKRGKYARHHGRHFKKHVIKTRHGKIVKAHKRGHVVVKVVKTPKVRAN